MFPQLAQFTDLSLLSLRLMVAAIFVTSGWSHLRDPKGRAESIGVSPAFTMFLGAAELAGGLGVAGGVLTQLAATGLILVMLGAIDLAVFNNAERLVIELADAMADTPSNVSEELYTRLRNKYSEEQLLQLGAQIAFENYRARLNRVFDVESNELYKLGQNV